MINSANFHQEVNRFVDRFLKPRMANVRKQTKIIDDAYMDFHKYSKPDQKELKARREANRAAVSDYELLTFILNYGQWLEATNQKLEGKAQKLDQIARILKKLDESTFFEVMDSWPFMPSQKKLLMELHTVINEKDI